MQKRILRCDELSKKMGVSKSTLWRWRKNGSFPEPTLFGPRIVGWIEEDIDKWISNQQYKPTSGRDI